MSRKRSLDGFYYYSDQLPDGNPHAFALRKGQERYELMCDRRAMKRERSRNAVALILSSVVKRNLHPCRRKRPAHGNSDARVYINTCTVRDTFESPACMQMKQPPRSANYTRPRSQRVTKALWRHSALTCYTQPPHRLTTRAKDKRSRSEASPQQSSGLIQTCNDMKQQRLQLG